VKVSATVELVCISIAQVIERLGDAHLLKLDCEGSEWTILQDAVALRRVKYLTMEYYLWASYPLTDLMERLSTLGLRVTSQEPSGRGLGLTTAERQIKG
jgi:hypothetical protein